MVHNSNFDQIFQKIDNFFSFFFAEKLEGNQKMKFGKNGFKNETNDSFLTKNLSKIGKIFQVLS